MPDTPPAPGAIHLPRLAIDAASGVLLACSLAWYAHNLDAYLGDLARNWAMVAGFWCSLILAIWRECRFSHCRFSVARVTATCTLFAASLLLAQCLRGEYAQMRNLLCNEPALVALLGAETVDAMSNRVVGFGGCFALSLLVLHWTLDGFLAHHYVRRLVPTSGLPAACPHCGSMTPPQQRKDAP